jgi:hypothetical protein
VFIAFDREPMILRRDKHASSFDFLDRVISPPVAISHLRRRASKSEPQKLVSEADPKSRNPCRRKRPNGFLRVPNGCRIARPVGKEDSVGLERERCFGIGVSRDDGHPTVILAEQPQDVALDPVVVRHDVVSGARVAPRVGFSGGHP